MKSPGFFEKIESIKLTDELSELLGTFTDGLVEFSYEDVAKLSGHSCPTVAGAYLMAREGLKVLCGEELPLRGEIEVQFRDDYQNGTTGVVANVLSYITGATDGYGFKGIGGKYARHSLLSFSQDIASEICLKTKGKSVCVSYDPSSIPPSSDMGVYMQKCLQGIATDDERKTFHSMWQQRVQNILLNYKEVLTIR